VPIEPKPVPLVTVVVPTRNVERTLDACLASVSAQDHPSVELIIVDNHSTDRTPQIARAWTDNVESAGPERSAQRNLGYALATGDWIAWIDSDMVLPSNLVTDCLRVATRDRAEAVSIPERSFGPGFWTACRTLERSCYLDCPSLFNPRFLCRGLLESLGGFDEGMSGPEDTHLRHALHARGIPIAMADAVILHDEGELSLRSIVSKRVYYGRSIPAFERANPGRTASQGVDTMRALWRHRGDLAADPVHGMGVLTMRGVEAVAYGVGAWQGRRG
jgi:arabinofuranan 3-O-arabinosyltransferase